MACAALAGIGFDKTQCKLISDARLEVILKVFYF